MRRRQSALLSPETADDADMIGAIMKTKRCSVQIVRNVAPLPDFSTTHNCELEREIPQILLPSPKRKKRWADKLLLELDSDVRTTAVLSAQSPTSD